MDSKNIKAVIFDFGGTIDADGIDWKNRLFDFFVENKIPIDREEAFKAFYKAMSMLDKDSSSRTLSYRQTVDIFIYWSIKNLSIVIENYKKAVVEPFWNSSVNTINKNRKIFERLAQKYTLGILSNNFGNCQGWCKEFKIDDFFKIIIDSADVGMEKPDKEIFKLACDKLEITPEEAAYVGDKFEVDMISARELGMLPIWINSFEAERSDLNGIIRIKKLEEIKKIFDIRDEIKLLM